MAAAVDISLFTGIGLSEQKAKETIKNEQVSQALKLAIEQVCIRSHFHGKMNVLRSRQIWQVKTKVGE